MSIIEMMRSHFQLFILTMLFFSSAVFGQVIPLEEEGLAKPEYLLDTVLDIKYDESDPTVFSADQLLPRVHEEFLGALFVCNPYCEVIGTRLTDDGWKPNLSTVKVTSKNIKLLDVDDPLFLALFPEKKQEAVVAKNKRQLVRKQKALTAKAKAKKQEKNIEELTAPPPKTAFDNAYRYFISPQYTLINHTTDSNVQADLKPKSGLLNVDLGIGYFRGRPLRVWRYWLQFEAGLDLTVYKSKVALEDNTTFDLSKNRMYLTTWMKKPGTAWGFRLTKLKQTYTTSTNSLTAFSFSEDTNFVGLAVKHKRYRFFFDYGLSYALSEKQPFRDKLQKANQYMVSGEWCSPRRKKYGVIFTPCYGGSYLFTENGATFDPAINPNASVNLTRHDLAVFANIYFGEDFLR